MKFRSTLGCILLSLVATHSQAGLFGKDDPVGIRNECLEKHSKAWCAMDAAQLARGFDDFKKAEVFKNTNGSVPVGTVLDIGMVGATAFGLLPSTPGIGNGAAAGMLVLSLLTERKANVLKGDQVFGWMPMELAKTPEDAFRLFQEMIYEGSVNALKDFELQETTSTKYTVLEGWTFDRVSNLALKVRGQGCGNSSKCTLILPNSIYSPRPKEGVAPEWMGGFKAWVFDGGEGAYRSPNLMIGNAYQNTSFAAALSKNLPDWMWISLGPAGTFGGVSRNVGLKVPLAFNKGQVLVPIFPEVDFRQDEFKIGSGI